MSATATLARETFRTSRLLEYFSEKELVDNALDAAEEAGVLPDIAIELTGDRIVVADNGPGLPATVIEGASSSSSSTSGSTPGTTWPSCRARA